MRFRQKIMLLKKKLVAGKTLTPCPWTILTGLCLWTSFSLILLIVTSCTYHYSLFKRSSIEVVYWDSPWTGGQAVWISLLLGDRRFIEEKTN